MIEENFSTREEAWRSRDVESLRLLEKGKTVRYLETDGVLLEILDGYNCIIYRAHYKVTPEKGQEIWVNNNYFV